MVAALVCSESEIPAVVTSDSRTILEHFTIGDHVRPTDLCKGNCWSTREGPQHSGSSSDPVRNLQGFPSLEETKLIKSRKKKYGPPFDSSDHWFKYKVYEKDFPFDDIGDEAIKLKFAPIELC